MYNIGIIGAGSWGTALAVLLNSNGHSVTLWSYSQEEIDMLTTNRQHVSKLPGIHLADNMNFTSDIKSAITGMDFCVIAVPSPFIRNVAKTMAPYVIKDQILVDVSKGIEDTTLMTLTQQIKQEIPQANVAVLSGPSHAEEVGKGLTTSVVIGAQDSETAKLLQSAFMNKNFRVYINSDMLGIELGGSLKNVVALAAGIADGLGCGDNAKAALITRGVAEITRLGVAMGGKPETFAGLAGIGDLIVTCSSVHSRNRKCGYLIGTGLTLSQAQEEVKMVVEGVYSAKAAVKLGKKHGVSMPLAEAINQVLFEDKNPMEALDGLMLRDGIVEHSNLKW